jgi:hypothetical protein
MADAWDHVITDTDQSIQSWIGAVIGDDTKISALPPSSAPATHAEVRAYLCALAPAPPLRERAPPYQLIARYLVTSWGKDPADEHRLIGRLLGAALRERADEVDLAPPPIELWRAFGAAPRPCFFLQVPVRVERAAQEAPLVIRPPVLRTIPTATLVGRVLGQNDIPLVGASVKHEELNVIARTDRRGVFRFGMVPASKDDQNITVSAKGKQVRVAVRPDQGRSKPILIRFVTKEA